MGKSVAVNACNDNFDVKDIAYIKANNGSILFLYADSVETTDFNNMQFRNRFRRIAKTSNMSILFLLLPHR